MKKVLIFLFFVFSYPVFGQLKDQGRIFNDTSLYFIRQLDSLNPVNLSAGDLAEAEKILLQAIEEFNLAEQRFADSVNPKKKKRKQWALRIDANYYNFRLIPVLNSNNEKMIRISGNCKRRLNSRKKKGPVYDKNWKHDFINGMTVLDGGTCFIYLVINLTLKTHDRLGMNGMA